MKHLLNKTLLSTRVGFLVLMTFALAATGQVMLSPVSIPTNTMGEFAPSAHVTNMINQSGVSVPFVSGVTSFETYFATPGDKFHPSGNAGTNNWNSQFYGESNILGYVDFDLGDVYQLNKIAIWNFAMRDIRVKVLQTLDGAEQDAGSYSNLQNHVFFSTVVPDVLTFSTICQGRYVRLYVDTAYATFSSPGFSIYYAIVGEVVLSASPIGQPPAPTLSLARQLNGDVTLTFTGTLQSSTNAATGYQDVQGNPQGTHNIPKASALPQQFFRARN